MADIITSQLDYEAIAQKAYEWLKKRRTKSEISTSEVVLKVMGLKWKDLGDIDKADEFFLKADDALLSLIKKENEYVADFSAYKDMYIGQPYSIPFVFRKNCPA